MTFSTLTDPAAHEERPWALADLPPYRPVAKRLMTLTSYGDVPLLAVEQVLRTDAAFVADVLRLANSPLTGMHVPVTSIREAVMRLGLERIKSLATTLALRAFLANGVPAQSLYACWKHNLASAIVCEKLARVLHLETDNSYTAGLLHDIGQLALLQAFPDKYENIFDQAEAPGFDLLKYEESLFDIDHCRAGRWILKHWEFPEPFWDVVSRHHQPPRPGDSNLFRCVYAGSQIANQIGYSGLLPVRADLDQVALALPEKVGKAIVDQIDNLAEEVDAKIKAVESSLG